MGAGGGVSSCGTSRAVPEQDTVGTADGGPSRLHSGSRLGPLSPTAGVPWNTVCTASTVWKSRQQAWPQDTCPGLSVAQKGLAEGPGCPAAVRATAVTALLAGSWLHHGWDLGQLPQLCASVFSPVKWADGKSTTFRVTLRMNAVGDALIMTGLG